MLSMKISLSELKQIEWSPGPNTMEDESVCSLMLTFMVLEMMLSILKVTKDSVELIRKKSKAAEKIPENWI